MKKFLKGKRIIALLLCLLLVVQGCGQNVNGPTGSNETEQAPTSNTSEPTDPTKEADVEGYHEVKFALANGMTEDAIEKTTLPVTTMIKDGTLIYSMKAPRQEGSVFLGWYYDDALELMVGPEDKVDHNMTLYPKFGLREDYEGEFSYDFIAEQNVSKNYPVLLVGHNLTAEEVAEFIKVTDTGRDGDVPFVVEPYGEPEEFNLEELVPDEEKRAYVEDRIRLKEDDPDFVLSEALEELELDKETVDAILKECAEDEWGKEAHAWLNDEARELMEAAGIDEGFSGVLDVSKMYELEEDDSPARYWREELGFEPEEVLRMLEIVETLSEEAWNNTATYVVKPEDGEWIEGHSYDVEILDTASVRFLYNAEETIPKIIYHKFEVAKQEFNNIAMNTEMVFIPKSEVQGVDSLGGLYGLVMDNEGNTTETSKRGVLTYAGTLTPGQTIAIYDGTLKADRSVDGNVGYFKIAEALGGGKYRYDGADMTDVIFLPDVIPLPDDGSFGDGQYTIPAEALNFNTILHRELKLDGNTSVDAGDYVVFFTGSASKTDDLKNGQFAKITAVEQNGNETSITYTPSSVEELHRSADMYMKVEQLDIPVEEVDEKQLEAELLKKVEESNFISATSDYITSLVLGDEADLPDDPDMAQGLKDLKFATDTGEELTLDEVRRLAGGASKVEVSKPTVAFTISLSLKHFHGKGARAVVTAGFTISIGLNGDNKLEIQVAAAIEQEIQLGLDIDVDTEWDFLTLEEIYVDVALKAGTYTGFGGNATVMTKEDNPSEDKEWNELVGETGRSLNKKDTDSLLNMGDTVGRMATAISAIQEGGTVSKSGTDPAKQEYTDDYKGPQVSGISGDLPAKYSDMLENDAEYVDLVKFELFRLAASPDPFHLIEFSISANVKIAFKVNAMIGFSLSYGNGRKFGYHIKCFAGSAKQSNDYYEKPNFRVDFFVFGMLGIRAGIELDARVGLISTKFDSIGITAEVGLYAELYGFLYMYYSWVSDQGSDKGIMGSLLFEIGIYLEINFKAQVGDGKYEKEIELYSNKWPLLQLGATEVPVPFQEDEEEDEEALSTMLEIPMGKNTVKVPDAVFGIDMMALSSGEVERKSQDSNKVGAKNYEFVINGRTFTQYNEEHFDVTCYDLDGKDGKVTKNHSFQYLPATNEIYVKPVDSTKDEVWGIVTFTYRNESFGFSTIEIKRTLKVHWKGDPCSASVEYYLMGDNGYELVKEGSFDGFDGIEYDIMVDEDFVYQFPTYRLAEVEFPDSDRQWDVVQKAYDEMHRLYDIYQKKDTNANKKIWWAAHEHWNTLWNKANLYDWNNEQIIKNKKGTLYFLMVKNETVVKLYFKSTTRYVPGALLYEDAPTSARTFTGTYIKMSENIYDKLQPEVDYFLKEEPAYRVKSDYYVYFTDKKFMTIAEAIEKKSEWQVLTKDMTMPDSEAFVFAYINSDKPFTLTWMDRGEIVRQDQLIRWQDLPAPPETKPYPGYTHSFYSWTKDTGENLMTNSRMDARDVTYTLRWTPAPQTITWEVDGETWTTNRNTDELIAPKWPAEYRGSDWKRWGQPVEKEGYTLTWKVKVGDQEGEFNPAMKTPAGGATLTAVYTVNSYNVIWKDGDTVVKEETLEFGTPLNAPALDAALDSVAVWQLDGKDLASNATMPGRDITILSARHTHDWKEDRVLKASNCNTEGEQQYKCSICGITKKEPIPIEPEAHNWYRRAYSIPNCTTPEIDYYVCLNCNAEKTVEVGEVDPNRHIAGTTTVPGESATCGKDGHYASVICNGCGKLISGGGTIPATGRHDWTVSPNPAATCTTDGIWDYTCTVCGATKQETAPAIGHDWNQPYYEWSDDLKTVTASRVCKNDGTHVETETVSTTTEVITAATCTSVGQLNYYAVFTNPAFARQSRAEEIAKIPHIWSEPVYTWSDDLKTVTAKRVCQYDTNESHAQTEVSNTKSVVTTEPGCETTGIRTYTANFTNSAFNAQVKEEVVPANGHSWGSASYTWADDNTTVTATHNCTADGSHTESETVQTTTSNRIEPTCENAGSVKYTATFTKAGFEEQTKTETLAAKGHNYGEPTYTWADDYSTVTAERICANDAAHKETETVVTTSEITKPATFEEMGETTYTATFTNGAFAVQTQTVTNIDKVPEGWTSPTYTWSSDYSTVTASRIRTNDNFEQTETVSATGTVTTPATCEAKGMTTYVSAEFQNTAFAVQTKVVDNVPALGHNWGAAEYTWADDLGSVTAKRTCGNDAAHVETEQVATTREVTEAATCQATGTAKYTATFTNAAFTAQTKTEILPVDPDGHVFTTVVRPTFIQEPMIEGSSTLVRGRTIKVCSACGIEEVVPGDPIEPALMDDQIDFYSITDESLLDAAAGKTLQDIMDKLGGALTAYVSAPSNPNGSGYAWSSINAEFTWAENYSSVLLSDLAQQFTADPDLKYPVKVHIKPAYFVSSYDGTVYEGQLGSRLYGSIDALKEVTVDLELIAHSHQWQWKEEVAHTDTEDGYDEYECSVCHAIHREYIPAGHNWEPKDWLDDGELPLEETYAYRDDAGSYEDIDGNHYSLHLGGRRYRCSICDAVKEETSAKLSLPEYYYRTVMNKTLIEAGYETVWDVDPSQYMGIVDTFKLQNGEEIDLLVPGTFKWAIGQQSELKSTTLESLKDPSIYNYPVEVTFTPEDTETFEEGTVPFVIENWYHSYNHENHQSEATFEMITTSEPHWDPEYNGSGGWVGGHVYSRCSICGKEELDHYILLPAYVANKLDGTVTAGSLPDGTQATITVTAAKLIELFGDQTIGYLLDNKRCNYSFDEAHPWYEFFTVFYSDDGTLTGTHCDQLSHGRYTGYVQFISDVSTLPRDTKFSELTSGISIELTTYINTTTFAPVTITFVIQP